MMKRTRQNYNFLTVYAIIVLFMIACYKGHGLGPTGPEESGANGIRGIVTFTGVWPDSTKEVRVAALRTYPKGITARDSLLNFIMTAYLTKELVFSDTIPRFINKYDYELDLKPGEYEWILVAWFPDIKAYLFGVKELGAYYKNPSDKEMPTSVYIMPGVISENINIEADFNNVYREVPFF